jgi:hypothetical protein
MSTLAKAVHRGADGSVLGVRRLPFDCPCRLVHRGDTGSVQYESISSTWSTSITVSPGQQPNISELIGICTACVLPPFGRPDNGHDYELWPECPSSDREKKRNQDGENVVPPPSRSEPVKTPVAANGAVSANAEGAQNGAGVRWLDAKPAREPQPSAWELEARWGGPAGSW